MAQILSEERRVLLVDTDPQESATWWVERGSVDFDLAQESDPSILNNLTDVSGYDVVLVDTQPALTSSALAVVLQASDYIILPTPPAPMDLTALMKAVRSVVAPSGVPHRVLLTRVDSRSLNEALEAQNALMESKIPVFHAFVRAYKAHERAALEGLPKPLGRDPTPEKPRQTTAGLPMDCCESLLMGGCTKVARRNLADLVREERSDASSVGATSHLATRRVTKEEAQAEQSVPVPKYLTLLRKEARLREDQTLALARLARQLNRQKRKSGERITENTLIRVAVDLLLSQEDQIRGATEHEIRQAITPGILTRSSS